MEDRRFPFEKVAKLDSPERNQRQPAEPLVELIASFSPSRVLEIGVGTGYFALPICQRLPQAEVVGVDIEPRILEVAGERAAKAGLAERLRLLEQAAEELQLDDPCDLALMANIYHELPDREGQLGRLKSMLLPGGRLVICDWAPEESPEMGPPNDHRVDPERCRQELESAGYSQVKSYDLYQGLFTLVATS